MTTIDGKVLTESLFLADALRVGRQSMLEPQELPGRYGRVALNAVNLIEAELRKQSGDVSQNADRTARELLI